MKKETIKKILADKRFKPYAASALVIVIIGLAAAGQAGAFNCSASSGTYAGQTVDGQQAIAKVRAFAGSNSDLMFDNARAARKTLTVKKDGIQTTMTGFVVDVPFSYGGFINYGEGYLLANDGTLYRLSGTGC